ncbi:MAG: dihydropteroate synthase [Endomicrobiales bacterium]
MREAGADPYGAALMAEKSFMRALHLRGVDNRAANLIKQEMLSLGGEAAVSIKVSGFMKGSSDVLVFGTPRQYRALLPKLALQPFGLKEWKVRIEEALARYGREEFVVPCGAGQLKLGRVPVVMGILNVTPDSFSDGGRFYDVRAAVEHGRSMEEAGAGIIDIGGESTRPGARPVTAAEERARVVPVIRALAKRVGIPVSVDTYKPEVARAALDAGASIVNDISGLRHAGGAMAEVVRRRRVPVIVMHMQGSPRNMQKAPRYTDVVDDIGDFFAQRISFARERGIRDEQIVLDPGIGFGKTFEHNLELLRRLREFRALGRPLAIGTSRKAFLGHALGGVPPPARRGGSVASSVWAMTRGAHIVRVHDVEETVQAARIIMAIRGTRWSI